MHEADDVISAILHEPWHVGPLHVDHLNVQFLQQAVSPGQRLTLVAFNVHLINKQEGNTQMSHTRGQRPNESQKAVIIDMMKLVGEITSKM